MSKRTLVALAALASFVAPGVASAEPLKVALIETLSGPASLTGKMVQSATKFALAKMAEDKVWPDGIQLLEYDNQSGPSEAADKLKTAINDGAHIVIQGASSAIAGQITGDVQKHNARNPGKEVMFINVGGQAMELTGTRCHFYHFRWNTYAEGRMRAMFSAAKETGGLGKKVYIHRPELQLGTGRPEDHRGLRQAVRLRGGRRRAARRQQDPGLRALRRQDQGRRRRHGGDGQLGQ